MMDTRKTRAQASLTRQFMDFLLAREALIEALDSPRRGALREALCEAYAAFFELAADLLPAAPDELRRGLTSAVLQQVCLGAARQAAGEAAPPAGQARVIECLGSFLAAQEAGR